MVNSEKAGVAFTADPSNGAQDRVVIEGAFGLGEVVVSGEVEPDTYVVAKENLEVLHTRLGHKAFKIVRGQDGQDTIVDLDDAQADSRVLDENELRSIAELAIATERHNGCPQDTEWAIADGRTYLVQARPITTLRHTSAPSSEKHAVLARGLAAAPGMASGKVRVLETPDEGERLLGGDSRRSDDQSGLVTHHSPGRCAGDQYRRHDVSRRNCGSRVGSSLRGRDADGDQGPA